MVRASRLRRPTLVAAPMFLVGLMGSTAAVATALWGAWNPAALDTTWYVVEVASLAVGVGAFVAARGCFVEVDPSTRVLRDVVAWVTVRRVAQDRIQTARVRAGAWRWFELEMDDGTRIVVAGASPAQFPSRLMPGYAERDVADLDLIMGEQPAGASSGEVDTDTSG